MCLVMVLISPVLALVSGLQEARIGKTEKNLVDLGDGYIGLLWFLPGVVARLTI